MFDQQQGGGRADGYARLRHGCLIGILYRFQPDTGTGRVGAFEGEPEQRELRP